MLQDHKIHKKIIENSQDLANLCKKIKKSKKIIAMDTEFMRERTYYPILCLIQINVDKECFAIDALAKNLNLKPFLNVLNDKKIKKILHSSYQDLEAFHQINKKNPKGIVDTQMMANFCGFNYNISYGKLVKEFLDIQLDKEQQRSNWKKRPLSQEQIDYAHLDTLYLPKVYEILKDKLKKQGKLKWFTEEMNSHLNCNYDTDNQNLYKKFSSNSNNPHYERNIQILAQWRDEMAKKRNIPRTFIMKDDLMNKIAQENPKNWQALERCFLGHKDYKYIKKWLKDEILRLLTQKESKSFFKKLFFGIFDQKITDQLGNYNAVANSKLSKRQNSLYQKARDLLQKNAKKYNIKPEFIINQNNLKRIILGVKKPKDFLSGWRYEVFGKDFEKIK